MPWIIGLLFDIVVGYAIGYAVNYFFGKKADPRVFSPKFEDNQAQVRSAVESHKIVYGKSLTSGPLTFAATNGPGNLYMHIVVPLTGHEVKGIDTVYFDDISSSGTEYNKLETWTIHAFKLTGSQPFAAVVEINGEYFYGSGNNSRVSGSIQATNTLLACITGSPGYAAQNYTAYLIASVVIEIKAKALDDVITVSNYWTPVAVPIACGGANAYTLRPGTEDFSIKRTVKGHIFDLYKHLGAPTQTADANLVAENVGWTTNHRLRGRAYLYAKLGFYADRWPTGIPVLKAEVRGRLAYDPRTALTDWTDNPAVCIRDYLTQSFGLNAGAGEINDATFIAAANISDEYVLASSPKAITSSSVANPTVLVVTGHKLRNGDEVVIAGHTGSTPSLDGNHTVTVRESVAKAIVSSSVANPTVLQVKGHGLVSGDSVTITGHNGSTPNLNGTHVVTVLTADTVTVPVNVSVAGSGGTLSLISGDTLTIPVNVTVGGTGGTIQLRQKRYTCNGTIALGERPIDIIQKMLTALDGTLVYSEGKYSLFAGAYTAPVGDLNESHLRSGMRVVAKPPRKQLFNGVRGTILDPKRFWQETDFPVYKNGTYATEDGEEIIRDITLPFTSDAFAAQRLAKQILERARQSIMVVFPAKLHAFKYSVNDVVRLSIAYLGWTNKEFRIVGWSLTDFGVDVTLQEEASASYNWNNGDETIIDPAPNSNLPSVFDILPPTGVTAVEELYQSANTAGIKTRIKVDWVSSTDINVIEYVVYWYSYPDSTQATLGVASAHSLPVRGNTFYIEDLSPGTYFVGVKAFNDLGLASPETALVQVVLYGNTANPADVTGFNAYQNGELVVFTWLPISDVDLLGYEVRYGAAASAVWETATQITRAERGTEITSALIPPGDWKFFIKAQDTTLLYSVNAATDNVLVISLANLVSSVEHEPDWLGTITNFVRHWTGKLIPDDQNPASFYTNFEWCDIYVPTPYAVCTYETPEIDTAFDDTLRVWAGAAHALGPGVATGAANAVLEVDYHTTAGAYDGYETTSIGFREGRYWKFKLTHDTTIGKGVISEFQTALDKQAVVQAQQGIAVASGGTTVVFPAPYHTRPTVSVTPLGATPLTYTITNITTTGFTVRLYDAGTPVAGSIDYYATGA